MEAVSYQRLGLSFLTQRGCKLHFKDICKVERLKNIYVNDILFVKL